MVLEEEPQPIGRGSFFSEYLNEMFPDALMHVPELALVGEQSSGKTSLTKKLLMYVTQNIEHNEMDMCRLLNLLKTGVGMATRHPTFINLRRSEDWTFWTNANEIEESHGSVDVAYKRPIHITITGPGLPNLSFKDLPGLVTDLKPLGDDPSLTVKSLVELYVTQPYTTVIVVESVTVTDFDNSHVSPLLRYDS